MEYILPILINAVAFFIGAKLLSGITIKDFKHAIIAAIVISLLNFTLGFVLKVVTLGLLGWGIFHLILDAILISIADYFLDGLKVKNFWWAFILAAFMSLTYSFMTWILNT